MTLRTEDGVTIAATWYEPASRPAPAVILVHTLQQSRGDWEGLASRLAREGIGALAIDLRGHGDSSGRADPSDYSTLAHDVRAARRFLSGRSDVVAGRIGIAGASIGASVAVIEAAGDPAVVSLALLSPSLDSRGLRIDAPLRKYGGRPALLVVSDDDPYAMRSAKEMQKAGGGTRELLLLSHAGHGTAMLAKDPDLARALVDWFRRTLL